MKKACSLLLTLSIGLSVLSAGSFAAASDITVTVEFGGNKAEISDLIYGINDFALTDDVSSVRQGGNRYTGYNWENNYSNAGSDWKHYSDSYLINDFPKELKSKPGAAALWLSDAAKGRYKITTLQMAGYVSADRNGAVSETAPSSRWKEVRAKKGGAFSMTPDTSDNYVYMDEYVNYLVKTLGDSTSENGINGYLLDNEPALWCSTHPKIHPDKVTYAELVSRSVELASAVKSVDQNAEIYGPSLYGMGAFKNLQDASDADGSYDWFVSYYLDQMKKAEESCGKRLLDVFDIHYYSEATGSCRITQCDDPSHTECIKARLQSVRSLDEEGYRENSWIGQWCKPYLPVLTRIRESVDRYYPGTKISLTEYSFGGGNQISGGIAEVDALGTFAKSGVYLATLWDTGSYQKSAISLYTNYDSKGSSFGDTFVPSQTSNKELCTAYASIHSENKSKANLVLTNKSLDSEKTVTVKLNGADSSYKTANIYGIDGSSANIKSMGSCNIENNSFTITLPALCAVQIELLADSSSSGETDTDSDSKNDIQLKGDINLDGSVNITDVVLIRSHIVGNKNLSNIDAEAEKRADVNEDNSVDIIDVVITRAQVVNS